MNSVTGRALQSFLIDTYGRPVWEDVLREMQLDPDGFEWLLEHSDAVTDGAVDAAASRLTRDRDDLLEDMGIYLISHPNMASLRRLLRYGGPDFEGFLFSLRDIPDRARLVLPDLQIPAMRLNDLGDGRYRILCRDARNIFLHVLVGALRALADDYGVLAVVDLAEPSADEDSAVHVTVLASQFAEGRSFELAGTTR